MKTPESTRSDDHSRAVAHFRTHGFTVLPGQLSVDELAPAQRELAEMFPTPEEFHDGVDETRNARYRDEFAGITNFPFDSTELSLLTVHPKITTLVEALLGTEDIRLYSAEAWAKYTGAADYDQPLHRDYLNGTILVPTEAHEFQQVEIFLYLFDVPQELGPPHFVSWTRTRGFPALPNWLSRDEQPEWYEAEVSGKGPAGTLVAYTTRTFHRGTPLTAPRGARYTIHVGYRPADAEWGTRAGWADRSYSEAWNALVGQATVRQLLLFGFPPPGHPFWTDETIEGVSLRYPQMDLEPFRP